MQSSTAIKSSWLFLNSQIQDKPQENCMMHYQDKPQENCMMLSNIYQIQIHRLIFLNRYRKIIFYMKANRSLLTYTRKSLYVVKHHNDGFNLFMLVTDRWQIPHLHHTHAGLKHNCALKISTYLSLGCICHLNQSISFFLKHDLHTLHITIHTCENTEKKFVQSLTTNSTRASLFLLTNIGVTKNNHRIEQFGQNISMKESFKICVFFSEAQKQGKKPKTLVIKLHLYVQPLNSPTVSKSSQQRHIKILECQQTFSSATSVCANSVLHFL